MLSSLRHIASSRLAAAVIGGLVMAAVGGVAWATIPDSGGVIHGCVQRASGQLRVLDHSSGSCRRDEVALNWNQQGLQGVQGAQGPQGPQGDQGPSGAATRFITRFVSLPSGGSAARVFCLPGEKVTGGGGYSYNSSTGLAQDFPIDATGANAFGDSAVGWQVASQNFGAVNAFVICAS